MQIPTHEASPDSSKPQLVIDFWFKEIDSSYWFKKSADFDAEIERHFSATHRKACAGELASLRTTASGRLAEILVLDQFSRNLFRDTAEAFAMDVVALVIAQEGIALKQDVELPVEQRAFFYMPFMHSESRLIHIEAVELFSQPGLEKNLAFEIRHKEIIDRFGRYPHRNALLGRESSNAELEFLKQPGSSF